MKKYSLGILFVFFGLFVFSSQGLAEEQRKTNRYSGIVLEVNEKEKTIVVGKEKKALAMLFDASKTIFKNAAGLGDLKRGDKVVIEYDAVKGNTIAVTVTREQ